MYVLYRLKDIRISHICPKSVTECMVKWTGPCGGLYRISCQGWRVDSIYLSVCAVCFAFPWFIQDFLPGVESRFYLFISVRSLLCFPLVYTGFLARGGE